MSLSSLSSRTLRLALTEPCSIVPSVRWSKREPQRATQTGRFSTHARPSGPRLLSSRRQASPSNIRHLSVTAEHAVISAFDLFSIGGELILVVQSKRMVLSFSLNITTVGPSSSHTVGPMRAGKIFINDLKAMGVLEKVKTVKITLYASQFH